MRNDPPYLVRLLKSISSPLKPEELKVLRDQYEKEGDFVGVQTKFNYAWVRSSVQNENMHSQ